MARIYTQAYRDRMNADAEPTTDSAPDELLTLAALFDPTTGTIRGRRLA